MATTSTFSTKNIGLGTALRGVEAGVAAAQGIGVPMSIVIVDSSGLVKAMARMDGTSILSLEVAQKKAWTAAVTGAPTAGVHQFVASDAGSLLSMPHVTNFSVVGGGLPIQMDGACVGAVGVSGATVELDTKVAEAVMAALG